MKEPRTIGGYLETESFFSMGHSEFIDYCTGLAILSIGKGEFRSAIVNIINMAQARGVKHFLDKQS
jgi:hypothetical protein